MKDLETDLNLSAEREKKSKKQGSSQRNMHFLHVFHDHTIMGPLFFNLNSN